MSRIEKLVGLIVLAGVLGWGAAGHAQPSIPKDRIPSDMPAEVSQKYEKLYSSDPMERARAAMHLIGESKRATTAIPFLIAMFHDDTALYEDATLRARSLASSYGSPFPFPNSPGEDAARAVARIATRTGKPPIDALLVALKDKDRHVRANAIRALGEIKHLKGLRALELLRTLEPLVAGLEDECPKIRAFAARTLGLMELEKLGANDSLIEGLVARLDDEDQTVRAEAARTLGSAKDSRAMEPLILVLENPLEGPEVRKNAAETLGQIGDRGAVQPLVAALKDKDWRIRSAALSVANLIEDFRVLRPIVLDALQDKEWQVRGRAAGAAAVLGKLKDPGAFEVAIVALSDKQPNVRAYATQSLAELNDARAVTPLIAALRQDGNSSVRWRAAIALGKLGDPRAIGPLTAALKDRSGTVKLEAQRALEEISKAIQLRRI